MNRRTTPIFALLVLASSLLATFGQTQDAKKKPSDPDFEEGGSEGTESASNAGLEWLLRHLRAGAWRARDFTKACNTDDGPCRNLQGTSAGVGHVDFDVGVTALSMLAFSGYGHTHKAGQYPEYVKVLDDARRFLLDEQIDAVEARRDGRVGKKDHWASAYTHTIATMALAELYLMSEDDVLKQPVTRAVKLVLRLQNDDGGWRYGARGPSDTSMTGWSILALKTAKNCKLRIPDAAYKQAFERAVTFLDSVTDERGRVHYQLKRRGDNSSVGLADPYPFSKEASTMTAVGVLARLFAGVSRDDPVLRRGIKILEKHPPKWTPEEDGELSKVNLYYWYFGTYAMFQTGGKSWKRWNEAMLTALLSSQRYPGERTSVCVDGSWDPIGEWGNQGGRVYSTAIAMMTLEIYYRFERAREGLGL